MGRLTPYQPMGSRATPADDEQVADMFKKLAARSSPNVSVPDETQSRNEKSGPESWPAESKQGAGLKNPPRPVGKLQWVPREAGSMGQYDTSHWYSVCQIKCGEVESFEAWSRHPLTGGMCQLAVGLPDYLAARTACQKDADEHYARGDR